MVAGKLWARGVERFVIPELRGSWVAVPAAIVRLPTWPLMGTVFRGNSSYGGRYMLDCGVSLLAAPRPLGWSDVPFVRGGDEDHILGFRRTWPGFTRLGEAREALHDLPGIINGRVETFFESFLNLRGFAEAMHARAAELGDDSFPDMWEQVGYAELLLGNTDTALGHLDRAAVVGQRLSGRYQPDWVLEVSQRATEVMGVADLDPDAAVRLLRQWGQTESDRLGLTEA